MSLWTKRSRLQNICRLRSFRLFDVTELTLAERYFWLLMVECVKVVMQRILQSLDIATRMEHFPWINTLPSLARL